MQIGVIKIYPVRVTPLPLPPVKSSLPVKFTNIAIEISDAKGRVRGFGEGCLPPRDQIFLKDWIKAAASFLSVNTFPWNLTSIYEIRHYIESLPSFESLNPVVCAIETALLDILGRKQNKPLSAYFPSHHAAGFVRYAATIPTWFSKKQTAEFCRMAAQLGIRKIHLGVGADPRQTLNRLETVTRVIGRRCSLGLNPGFTWDSGTAAAHTPLLQQFPIDTLEDPMEADNRDLVPLARTWKSMGIKLIAGQPAATLETLTDIVAEGLYDTVSVQLSRNGGFHRTLSLINYLRETGTDFKIGCHPAESCILSAAGHVLNLVCSDAVDREAACFHLMSRADESTGSALLGRDGSAVPSRGTGLGMQVNPDRIARLKQSHANGKRLALTIKPGGQYH